MTTTFTTRTGLKIKEGIINKTNNSELYERITELFYGPSSRFSGGAFYNGLLFAGIEDVGVRDDSHARKLLNGLGLDKVIVNGREYSAKSIA